jgi:hypothetical protein
MNTKPSKSRQNEKSKSPVSPTVLTPERLAAILDFIGEDDLALCFDIRLMGAGGEVFQVKGSSSFTQAMRSENKAVVPKQFETVVINSLLDPLLQRFSAHIQENVINILPPAPGGSPLLFDDYPSDGNSLDSLDAEEENGTTDTQPDTGAIP